LLSASTALRYQVSEDGIIAERELSKNKRFLLLVAKAFQGETRRKEARATPSQKVLVLYQSNRMFLWMF